MHISKLNSKFISTFLIKTFIIWLILIIICIIFSKQLLEPFLFFFESIISFVSSGISTNFTSSLKESENILRLVITNDYEIKSLQGGTILKPLETLYVHSNNLTLLTPIIILFSLSLSWPLYQIKELLVRLFIGILISVILMLMTVPFQFIGVYEKQLWVIAKKNNETYIFSPLYYWQLFCDSGGVWLLAIIGAILSVALGEWWGRRHHKQV